MAHVTAVDRAFEDPTVTQFVSTAAGHVAIEV
jgi:hypothetical protein